nr:cell-to-cell movement protein [Sonchus yellow net nucleorhabdovirus]
MEGLSSKAQTMGREDDNRSSKMKVFHSELVYGDNHNISIKKADLTGQHKMMLLLSSALRIGSVHMDVSRILVKWCPYITPNMNTTIGITIKNNHHDDMSNINDMSTYISVKGKMSEALQITWHPASTLVYKKGMSCIFPWVVDVDTGSTEQESGSPALGEIKIWCYFKMQYHKPSTRHIARAEIAPSIEWGNTNFPYYVPFAMIRRARGIRPLDVFSTNQYSMFLEDVIKHVGTDSIKESDIVPIMSTMSREDMMMINEKNKACLLKRGGSYCSCKNVIENVVKEINMNRDRKYDNHGLLLSGYIAGSTSGRFQTVPMLSDISY